MPERRKLPELEGLRGLLALWVLVGHWAASLPFAFAPLPADLWNVRAVDVFIALSGFVICKLLFEQREPYASYLTRRLFRLAPVYLLVLCCAAPLQGWVASVIAATPPGLIHDNRMAILADGSGAGGVLLHALMLHGLVPVDVDPHAPYAFVGQAWSVSLEWQFYLLAPLLLPFGAARSAWVRAGAAAALLLVASAWMSGAFVGARLPTFALGAATFGLWRWSSSRDTRRRRGAARLVVVAASAGLVAVFGAHRCLGVVVWLLAAHCVCVDGGAERAARRLLSCRPALFMGRISYSLYLAHFLVLLAALDVIGCATPAAAAASLAAAIVGSTALAALLHAAVERPFMALGRTAARGLKAPSSAAPVLPVQAGPAQVGPV